MTSLGIHWRGLLIFILPPRFSFKNSTRVKTKVVFYQGGNLLRIQMSICHLFLCWTTCRGKKPLSSFSRVFQSSWGGFALTKTAGGKFIHWISFHFETKVYFYFACMSAYIGYRGCMHVWRSEDNFRVSSLLLQRVPWTQVVGCRQTPSLARSACQPSACSVWERSPLAVSREPRVLLGYTRLHALTHWEGRKVVLKHPSKSLTFYEFRTFLEKNQRPGIFQPFETRLWVIKSPLRRCTHTDTWHLCSLIWWENIPLGNKCKVGGGKWLHTYAMAYKRRHTQHACVH